MKQTGCLQQHSAAVPAASCDNMTLGRPRLQRLTNQRGSYAFRFNPFTVHVPAITTTFLTGFSRFMWTPLGSDPPPSGPAKPLNTHDQPFPSAIKMSRISRGILALGYYEIEVVQCAKTQRYSPRWYINQSINQSILLTL